MQPQPSEHGESVAYLDTLAKSLLEGSLLDRWARCDLSIIFAPSQSSVNVTDIKRVAFDAEPYDELSL